MDTKMEAVQESIKLALDAADAATDVTSEYNKVKKAHEKLEAKVKQIHKYTTIVFLSSIISGLVVITVSAFLFMQSSDKLTNMTETSREALVVFAENVDGVNASLKNLDNAIKEQGDLLEVNKKFSSGPNKWPVLTAMIDALPDAEKYKPENYKEDKLPLLSENPGKGD